MFEHGVGELTDSQHAAAGADPLAELLAASALRDRDAFAELYKQTAGRLSTVVSRILGRGSVSEEVLQESFVTIWQTAGQFRSERGKALVWMINIARNLAIDRLRREQITPREFEQPDEQTEGDLAQHIRQTGWPIQVPDAIHECLKELKDIQRKAIFLAYYYGMTHEELAVQLTSPLDTIKSWVRRGLLQLKECIA